MDLFQVLRNVRHLKDVTGTLLAPLECKIVQLLFANMPGLVGSMFLASVGCPRPSLVPWPDPEHQQQSHIDSKREARCKAMTFPRGEATRRKQVSFLGVEQSRF